MTVCPCAQELMREKEAAGLMRRGIAKKGYGCFFGYHTPGNAYSKR